MILNNRGLFLWYRLHVQKKYSGKPNAKICIDKNAVEILKYTGYKKEELIIQFAGEYECVHDELKPHPASSLYSLEK